MTPSEADDALMTLASLCGAVDERLKQAGWVLDDDGKGQPVWENGKVTHTHTGSASWPALAG